MRGSLLEKAIKAGKNVYCEKPISDSVAEALAIARLAESAGIKHGVVQDKLFLPGLRKLAMLRDSGFSARSSRCAASSAIGFSKAIGSRRSVLRGITA